MSPLCFATLPAARRLRRRLSSRGLQDIARVIKTAKGRRGDDVSFVTDS